MDRWWLIDCQECDGLGHVPNIIIFKDINRKGRKRNCPECQGRGYFNRLEDAEKVLEKWDSYNLMLAKKESIANKGCIISTLSIIGLFLALSVSHIDFAILAFFICLVSLVVTIASISDDIYDRGCSVSNTEANQARALIKEVKAILASEGEIVENEFEPNEMQDNFDLADYKYQSGSRQ